MRWHLGYQFVRSTNDNDIPYKSILLQYIRNPTATRNNTLPLWLLHVRMVIKHNQRERLL